eukprot:CAMPEP_0117049002 /NCGR_PEP_ID=MMETSP0472-20121206/33880_1 /TAXON_ID=693140 ORGANISM="Tiarina fusus, Strain LIS" /NCGR_SAMPLE_ID=MMETSP0472 /ASSEMBLY_ACC=CAM_ASM_000603 /LENGTH=157 /DNA_ID=CAMNT_0004762331 /DNA_START=96 /DNA_END=566 /DNA_ORIENTATION=-
MTERLNDWDNYFIDDVSLNKLCTKGEMFFTKQSLQTADLPRGGEWQWNQSRSKKKLSVDNELDISFCKLNTRKARGSTERSPPYKVWIFHMHFIGNDTMLNFAWCEKGDAPVSPSSEKGDNNALPYLFEPVEPQISLQELSFLHEFTDLFTARQLGW